MHRNYLTLCHFSDICEFVFETSAKMCEFTCVPEVCWKAFDVNCQYVTHIRWMFIKSFSETFCIQQSQLQLDCGVEAMCLLFYPITEENVTDLMEIVVVLFVSYSCNNQHDTILE